MDTPAPQSSSIWTNLSNPTNAMPATSMTFQRCRETPLSVPIVSKFLAEQWRSSAGNRVPPPVAATTPAPLPRLHPPQAQNPAFRQPDPLRPPQPIPLPCLLPATPLPHQPFLLPTHPPCLQRILLPPLLPTLLPFLPPRRLQPLLLRRVVRFRMPSWWPTREKPCIPIFRSLLPSRTPLM